MKDTLSPKEAAERQFIYLLLHDTDAIQWYLNSEITPDCFSPNNKLLIRAVTDTHQTYNALLTHKSLETYKVKQGLSTQQKIQIDVAFCGCNAAKTNPANLPLLMEQIQDSYYQEIMANSFNQTSKNLKSGMSTLQAKELLLTDLEKIKPVVNSPYGKLYRDMMDYREFPIHIFSQDVRNALEAYKRKWSCSIDYLANPLLYSISTAINTKYKINVNDRTTDAKIWGFAVGASGRGKSEPAKDIFALFDALDKQAKADFDHAQRRYEKQKIIYDAEISKFKRSKKLSLEECPVKPEEPHQRQYTYEFATIESIHEVISHNPDGIMLQIEEFFPWFESLGNYSNGSAAATMSQIQKYHDNDFDKPVKHGRKNKTAQIYTAKHYAIFYAQAQPDILPITILQSRLIHTGFVNRFFYFYPEKTTYKEPELQSYKVPQKERDFLNNIINGLYLIETGNGWTDFQTIYLDSESVDPETWKTYMDYFKWLDRIEYNENNNLPSVVATFIGRHKKHLSKLILNLHILDTYIEHSDISVIQLKTVQSAIALSRYYISHFLKLYEQFLKPGKKVNTAIKNGLSDYDKVLKYVTKHSSMVTIKQIQQHTHIRSSAIRPILEQLEKDGLGSCRKAEKGRNQGEIDGFKYQE